MGIKVTRESLIIWLSGTLLSKYLNAIIGILNTQTNHAKTIGLKEWSSSPLGGQNAHNIDQEGFEGLY